MLDPREDVLIYSDYLKPPEGFEFEEAVSTTYSLDLEAILFLPVALYFSKDIETNRKNKDGLTAVLDSLTRISEKVAIYCQEGKIKVPEKYNKLMAFWENNIHEVRMPNATSSFHPKIWILRFQTPKKNQTKYRFICTSRNLTLNRDWDVAFIVDGAVTKATAATKSKNKPLNDFLKHLDNKYPINPIFFDEILKIDWDQSETFDFVPILNDTMYSNPLISKKAISNHRLVMSPFLDKTTLDIYQNTTKHLTILSREEEINLIDRSCFKNQDAVYSFNSQIIDGENQMDTEGYDENFSQQLHAKYYIDVFNKESYIYLGSANMTCPASRGNIEFMVRHTSGNKNPIDFLINEITRIPDKKQNVLFEKHQFYDAVPKDESEELIWRQLVYELCAISLKGECQKMENDQYRLEVVVANDNKINLPEEKAIYIRPLPAKGDKQLLSLPRTNYIFGDYHITELSPYLVLSVDGFDKEILIKMDIDLPSERTGNIFRTIFDSGDKLLSHISFLLNGEDLNMESLEFSEDSDESAENKNTKSKVPFIPGVNLYEDLLIASSRNPEKFDSVNSFLKNIRESSPEDGERHKLLSDEFLGIWEVFYTFHKSKKDGR